jgi:hypothetical protein
VLHPACLGVSGSFWRDRSGCSELLSHCVMTSEPFYILLKHPVMPRIISLWVMLSPPCRPSATNHINWLLIALKRHYRNCHCVVLNVFCIVGMTEILIMVYVVCDVGKFVQTPSNVIASLPIWHCTRLGQVIKGLDFWSQVSTICLIGALVRGISLL